MNRKTMTLATLAILAIALFAMGACKSGGMAVTERGQLLKINIEHPMDLPDGGEENLDVIVSNRGVNNIQNVMIDVELPSQLVVLDQTNERGVNVSHDPGTNVYHFSMSNIQPTESSKLRFRVRTAFGAWKETESVKVTVWQKDLPGNKLVETAVIKLRS